MAIVADLSGHRPADKKLASPNRATVGSPYGVLYPQYTGELVLDAANGQLFVGGTPLLNTAWTPVTLGMYGSQQGSTIALLTDGGFSLKSPYYLSTTSSWINDDGVLEEAAINEPRSLAGGTLWEPLQANQITNPRAEGGGAVAPTSWSTSAVDAGITVTWEGQFVHTDGLTYQRIRFVGTPGTTLIGRIHYGISTAISATAANGIAGQVRVMLTGGSVTNAIFRFRMPNAVVPTLNYVPTATSQLITNRFTFASDIAQGLQTQFDGTIGMPVDFTVAYALPGAVAGDFFTNVPLPPVGSPAAFTRGATRSIAVLGTAFNKRVGTIVLEAMIYQQSSILQGIIALDNQTFDRRLYFYLNASANTIAVMAFDNGVQSFQTNVGTITIGTPFRMAFSYNTTSVTVSINGSDAATVNGAIPVAAFNRIYLGDLGIGGLTMNGIFYNAVYYETALGADLLKQATS